MKVKHLTLLIIAFVSLLISSLVFASPPTKISKAEPKEPGKKEADAPKEDDGI